MVSMEDMSIRLTILQGAYGYKGFTEQTGVNMYKTDLKAFQETIETAKEPINASKISKLSPDQIKVLQGAPSGSWLIPLLSRMGQLVMMDLREGLVNPKIFQYTSTMNAYKRSI
ncbi:MULTISPECIES: hypothetical protein [Lysinibacillus]|uniref:hypothetical protein n=1 Tax=Lysinibacillus TaxID=400634 RepID=UPI00214B1A10|nr:MULTISPECIES: hypothetical protein [Lysinibacillus]UUV24318.1 hypothetical protein NP781_21395 [Lysinibacillus sp. FN11]UYB47191.1 hypothetical protein OCI51_24010 [Lysinibacillus capsici]